MDNLEAHIVFFMHGMSYTVLWDVRMDTGGKKDLQSGSREYLFGILHNYTDDKSTSAILNIISQGVNIRDHNFKIIEAVSKYIIKSNRFT